MPPQQERAGFFDQSALCMTDLDAQAILDAHIRPQPARVEPPTEPAHISQLGATGFLGAFVLYELLRQTEADIHCLVRCANVHEGQKRIETNLP